MHASQQAILTAKSPYTMSKLVQSMMQSLTHGQYASIKLHEKVQPMMVSLSFGPSITKGFKAGVGKAKQSKGSDVNVAQRCSTYAHRFNNGILAKVSYLARWKGAILSLKARTVATIANACQRTRTITKKVTS